MTLTPCAIQGCAAQAICRGWCKKHYARWRTHGDPERVAWNIQRPPEDGMCGIDGCDRPYYYSGMCSGHYSRRRRKGEDANFDPLENRTYDPEDAFAARTRDDGSCIVWTGWLTPDGYGKFKTGGKGVFAHRYAWERVNGAIPNGYVIDHACRNPRCVNEAHLRLATPTENTRNLSGPTANNVHSGVRNVGKMGNRWRVRITKDGVTHAFGCYETIEQAAVVAERERARLFGEFAGRG